MGMLVCVWAEEVGVGGSFWGLLTRWDHPSGISELLLQNPKHVLELGGLSSKRRMAAPWCKLGQRGLLHAWLGVVAMRARVWAAGDEAGSMR